MKSYKNHLITTKSFGETKSVSYNPTMRSSAIFPLIHTTKKISSIYTFMGYWLKKRNIPIISVLVTIRDSNGKKIKKESIEVNSIKSYSIYSSDLLGKKNNKFFGSIEFEVFSAVDMVFPYPAITFGLKSVNGLTFVHTCGRIYNNFDDIKSNEEYIVPETGFDIFISKKYKPFFTFVNGPIKIKNKKIRLEFIDSKGRKKIRDKIIENVNPYGLGWINLLEDKEREFFKNEEKICVKVYHKFKGFFPRLVAGNILKNFQDMSLTHSYYDTSKKVSKSSYSHNRSIRNFYDSVTSIPFDSKFSEIELAIYPNMPTAPSNLKLELYTNEGALVDAIEYENKIATKNTRLSYIKLMEKFAKYKNTIKQGNIKIILDGKGTVPVRMKFGLNFTNIKNNINLPSNVCFSTSPVNEKTLKKPGTFRWCTIFDVSYQKIYLHNTSFVKNGFKDAEIKIQAYRKVDNKNLEWKVKIPHNGSKEILAPVKNKIQKFLNGELGWVFFSCSSPFVGGYYVTDYGNGVIGADHLY